MLQFPVYLDNAATTPCDERVVEAMLPCFMQNYGNASSRSHAFGWRAGVVVEKARQSVASLINATPQEIIFTSGATEGCNLSLRGVFETYAVKGKHIITTAVEHKAVMDTCKALQKKGASITWLKPNAHGIIDVEELKAAIQPQTILIAVMYANNETGVIQPIAEIGAIAKEHKVLFFCDATQAIGKTPVDVQNSQIDLLTMSAHKMYGPKGIGALYIRKKSPRVKLLPQITGGSQEKNLRSGTLNVPGIVGLGKASEICIAEMDGEYKKLQKLRDYLASSLLQIQESCVNGSTIHRLPHICNISFKYLTSSQMLSVLNKTLAISSGSACTSGSLDPSYVLKAMGIDDSLAKAALRFSLGRFTTNEEIDFAITEVQNCVAHLRNESFEWGLFIKSKQ